MSHGSEEFTISARDAEARGKRLLDCARMAYLQADQAEHRARTMAEASHVADIAASSPVFVVEYHAPREDGTAPLGTAPLGTTPLRPRAGASAKGFDGQPTPRTDTASQLAADIAADVSKALDFDGLIKRLGRLASRAARHARVVLSADARL